MSRNQWLYEKHGGSRYTEHLLVGIMEKKLECRHSRVVWQAGGEKQLEWLRRRSIPDNLKRATARRISLPVRLCIDTEMKHSKKKKVHRENQSIPSNNASNSRF